MAEWLYEEGIGENRAALVEGGEILEAALEIPGLRAGAVVPARLTRILVAGRRGIASLNGDGEALVEPLPREVTEGAAVHVEIVREPIPETGRPKRAKARIVDEEPRAGPSLHRRIGAPPPLSRFSPDRFEEAGWSELLEQAAGGEIPFPNGALRMSITPAMTLFDVDGTLPPAELGRAGAEAAVRAIRRFGIGGSIGIDLPTLAAREERQAAAAALDAMLPRPFERTAVNGFGFLQVVRRRERPSIPELIRDDPEGAAARTLLRRAERSGGRGTLDLHAAPAVIARIEENPDWLEELARRTGAPASLRPEPDRPIFAGHVHHRQS